MSARHVPRGHNFSVVHQRERTEGDRIRLSIRPEVGEVQRGERPLVRHPNERGKRTPRPRHEGGPPQHRGPARCLHQLRHLEQYQSRRARCRERRRVRRDFSASFLLTDRASTSTRPEPQTPTDPFSLLPQPFQIRSVIAFSQSDGDRTKKITIPSVLIR
jgi:hypothetical protein